ncbi:MAG TPA: glycoside hydrolase family 5 protein, partial [Anaerolineales bacterium]|nr:glycoside hydrolase family 5 protein [Anaerolineales bacterium]
MQPTQTPLPPTPRPEPTVTPIPSATLRRGVNLGNMLEAPNEGEWGLLVQEEYFDLIRQAGFDFVRLPVRWNAHAEESAPYTLDPAFLARVDEVVGWALRRDLAIIIDFHHYEEMASDPEGHRERFLGIWRQIAEHYRDYPPDVLFELLNEPTGQLDAALWNEYLGEALPIVRKTNPTRNVVIGPTLW